MPGKFDYMGAINEGYSPQEISDFVGMDIDGAKKEGYTDQELHDYFQSLDSEDPIADEMKILYKRALKYDSNKTPYDIVRNVSGKTGVNRALLFSSSFQEGMNKAINSPDEVSDAYINANKSKELEGFPVDGFYNYGVDTFGSRYKDLKSLLPEKFEDRFKVYKAKNEKGETVETAAFKTNEDALYAKAAILKSEQQMVSDYANKKGLQVDESALNYFTLASYNGGFKNAKHIIDEYSKAKDKKQFFEKGLTSKKQIHKNISTRLKNMSLADELLKD